MTEWGLTNGHLEPWDFGHPGWLNERFGPYRLAEKDALVVEVLAWTPSTKGNGDRRRRQYRPPTRLTRAEMDAWISHAKINGRLSSATHDGAGEPRTAAASTDRRTGAARMPGRPAIRRAWTRPRTWLRERADDPNCLNPAAVNAAVAALMLKAGC
jgi:hypothetical protein